MIAKAPNGLEITGTLEQLKGNAQITSIERAADGSLKITYGGYTEVYWDEQRTVKVHRYAGHGHVGGGAPGFERVFLDEEGNEWPECQVQLVEDNEQHLDISATVEER